MDQSIVGLIRTTDEQSEAINLIEQMLSDNFKKVSNPELANGSPFSNRIYQALRQKIQQLPTERETIRKMLDLTLEEVKKLNKIKMTLAIAPDEQILAGMEKWLNQNGLQNFIFDLSLNPKILGGAIIVSQKGLYKDYSLTKKIDEYFLTKYANGSNR